MKKFLCVFFSVMFVLSALAVGACADGGDVNLGGAVVVDFKESPEKTCEYCGKVLADAAAYATHLETCAEYLEAKNGMTDATNACHWCGAGFYTEEALNIHLGLYNECTDHVKKCPFSGPYYPDGGCKCEFTKKATYNAHLAVCPYRNAKYGVCDLLRLGEIQLAFKLLGEKIVEFLKGVDWGALLKKVVDVVKGIDWGSLISKVVELVKKIPFSTIVEKIKGLAG